MGLLSRKSDTEKVKDMVRVVNRQRYAIERDINATKRMNAQAALSIKRDAKKGNMDAARIIAKELVKGRKTESRLHTAKANLECIAVELKQQLSIGKLTGTMQKSTEVMRAMGQMVKLPELQKTTMELSKEMTKLGLMDEMRDDVLDSIGDSDNALMDDEVAKILNEITSGEISNIPDALTNTLPSGSRVPSQPAAVEAEDMDDQEELDEMTARLEALRN